MPQGDDTHEHIKASSASNSEDTKRDAPVHELGADGADARDVERGQQPLEKPDSDTDASQRDPKLVRLLPP